MEFTIGSVNGALWVLPPLAMKFVNLPYVYGGKTPLGGIDCSGLVCELLQAVGVLGTNEDLNSQMLYDRFCKVGVDGEIALGALAFYGESVSKISHVAMFLDTHLIVEAGHGTSQTLSATDALKRDAKVRIRPFNYRKDLVAVIRPKFQDYGLHD